MPHIGTQPPNGFSTSSKQSFNGDNSTTGFTLNTAVSSVTDIQVYVDNIRQEPTSAYTVSGTTLTFTEAPPTGTNNVYVVHTNSQATGLLPPQDLGTTDYIFGDDISFNSDGAIINFGADSDVTLTHVHNTGLTLNTGITATTGTFSGAISATSGTFTAHTTITTADNDNTLSLISTDADNGEGPILRLMRDSSSPADGDSMGRIYFSGDNDAGEETQFVRFQSILSDASDGTEDGSFRIQTIQAGTNRSRMLFDPTETVFNDDSVDLDFRVEGDGDANALFVEGETDKVGIGNNDPTDKLHVYEPSGQRVARFEANNSTSAFIVFEASNTSLAPGIGVKDEDLFLFTGDAVERMRFDGSDTHIGVGVTTPSNSGLFGGTQTSFMVGGSAAPEVRIKSSTSDADTALISSNSSNQFFIINASNGVALAKDGTSFSSASDENFKTIIENIDNAETKINSLRTVIGRYKEVLYTNDILYDSNDEETKPTLYEKGDDIPESKKVGDIKIPATKAVGDVKIAKGSVKQKADADTKRRSFLIAQDVQKVLPEAVSEVVGQDNETHLNMSYTDVIPLLVAGIKELSAKCADYETRIKTLEAG